MKRRDQVGARREILSLQECTNIPATIATANSLIMALRTFAMLDKTLSSPFLRMGRNTHHCIRYWVHCKL